jgi:predicted methyltransferase
VEVILRLALLLVAAAGLLASGCATERSADDALDRALAAPQRSPENRERDPYRHPGETLRFFGLRPDMTVVEVWPGGGWYTEILAPLLKDRGRLYAAHLDPASSEYARRTVDDFRAKLAARPDLYGKVVVTTLAAPPASNEIAPAGSADLVVTFRNLHNWMMFGWQREAFAAMHAALKPGGVLGVVDHRAAPGTSFENQINSGYMTEQYVIDTAQKAGFRLVGGSEVNANPKDTKDHPKGVWTLPPTLALGDQDRTKYLAIGESDRMTLKFVKP